MGWNLPEQLAGSSSRRLEADAIRELQLKWAQSGSSSPKRTQSIGEQLKRTQSKAAAEADASEQAAEADTNGEQQLKWIVAIARGAAAEADAIGEQQLCTESALSGTGLLT